MSRVYTYKTDKRTYYITFVYIILSVVAGVVLYKLYEGGYFSAWFLSLVVAIMALMALSIPRRVVVDEKNIVINCILEVNVISREDIVSVRKVDKSECKGLVPLLASCGFFGYFGLYIDLNSLERVKFYATECNNLVEIVDKYEDRYFISCREADDFVEEISATIDDDNIEEEID